mmetsp:Transcript_6574/g.10359  ORF Transcript_6574/g.10359 Transcript_6574/m.10359 type:complete len:218 (-) Transcript_6574:57-710(-)
MVVFRLSPSRINWGCGFVSSSRIMSPGICPGFCSLIRGKTILAPVSIPFSTVTTSSAGSSLHRSFDGTCSCCCTMKPPICRCTVRVSGGHFPHLLHFSLFLVVILRQPRQTTRRLTFVRTSPPLYMSSKLTFKENSKSLPRFELRPPPNIIAKGSRPRCSSPSRPPLSINFFTASIPPVSYNILVSGSPRISYALRILSNIFSAFIGHSPELLTRSG